MDRDASRCLIQSQGVVATFLYCDKMPSNTKDGAGGLRDGLTTTVLCHKSEDRTQLPRD